MVREMYIPPERRLAETLKQQSKSIQDAQRPTGTEKNQTLAQLAKSIDYLSSLKYYARNGGNWNTGTIPNDQTNRWDDGSVVEIANVDVPWNKMLVTASVGEASVAPATDGYVIAFVSFWVLDVNGDVAVDFRAYYAGRFYTKERAGISISTGPRLVTVDPLAHPGPYTVRLQFGHWASIVGTGSPSIQFNSPSLTVQIIGDGVPD